MVKKATFSTFLQNDMAWIRLMYTAGKRIDTRSEYQPKALEG
jgi:hypothetical protein